MIQSPLKEHEEWKEIRKALLEEGILTEAQLERVEGTGADSLDLVELEMAVEQRYGIRLR